MLPARRRDEIVAMVTLRGSSTLAELAVELGVSEATARRDINRLAAEGRLTRVYGGAVALGAVEEPFAFSDSTDRPQKRRIARAAAELVADGDTVVLDIGSTVLELARLLAGRPVTIITSNLAAYEVLRDAVPTELVLIGGSVRRNYLSTVGFLAEHAVSQLHADTVFLGTSGVALSGAVLDTTPVEVSVKKRMIASSDRVVLLAAERKFPGAGMSVICEATEIDVLVTSERTDRRYLAAFEHASARVIAV
jgi:DeoR/GlpR family transcriptional regulator of sugar metabolism